MGNRTAMFPDDYDEDWPYQASGIQGFLEEVRVELNEAGLLVQKLVVACRFSRIYQKRP